MNRSVPRNVEPSLHTRAAFAFSVGAVKPRKVSESFMICERHQKSGRCAVLLRCLECEAEGRLVMNRVKIGQWEGRPAVMIDGIVLKNVKSWEMSQDSFNRAQRIKITMIARLDKNDAEQPLVEMELEVETDFIEQLREL
jgi:hypothetical protein